ncbi:MAG: SUMF1/EgtB/PvdO family nonheme iron enzyme [Chloroflexi bacterium]|nr:SUMF1/EgtB/PvdO family nonheme iron enzyme [Chloroflexota bacterium]
MAERIFISYKRKEQTFAERLRDILRSWGFDTWLDVDDIPAGITPSDAIGWQRAILNGIKGASAVIGVITPDSIQSDIVLAEWESARQNKKRLILVRHLEFDLADLPAPFNLVNYIDLVENEAQGLQELREALQSPVLLSRRQIGSPPPPPPGPPHPEPPKEPEPSRQVPWSLTFQVIAILTFVVALVWMITDPGFEPLLAFLGAVTTQLLSIVSRPQQAIKLTDRDKMLGRVHKNWIEGVLHPALSERDALTIRHQFKPELVLKSADAGDYRLPPDAQIVDIFNALNKELLILGDPGAGKTVMLLQLADALIAEARADPRKPIPVVLNLASWALKREPLQDWVIEEMGKVYQVGPKVARGWLDNNDLLLLLDGLDEVKDEYRDACVTAINTFRQKGMFDFIRMAVCSRIRDYERLSAQLNLFAILLEPLSQDQIDAYLAAADLADLRDVIATDPILQDMAQTPFLLNTMAYAYQDTSRIGLATTAYERRMHLFNEYIQRRFAGTKGWTLRQSREYLTWLATKMQAYVQSVFYVDDISEEWLKADGVYGRFDMLMFVGWGLLFGLALAAPGIALAKWGAAVGLAGCGFMLGAAIGFSRERLAQNHKVEFVGLRSFRARGVKLFRLGLGVAVLSILIILPVVIGSGLPDIHPVLMIIPAVLPCVFTFRAFREPDTAVPVKRLLIEFTLMVLIPMLLILAIAVPQLISLSKWKNALVFTGVVWLIVLSQLPFIPHRITSGYLHSRLASASQTGILFGLLAGGFFGGAATLLHNALFGTAVGVFFLLYYGIFWGGMAVGQHLLLRLLLMRERSIPFRLENFLSFMVKLNIMREISGGYMFRHRYLLEHFSEADALTREAYLLLPKLHDEATRQQLIQIGKPAVAPLLSALEDRHIRQRVFAGQALGLLGDPRRGVGLDADNLPDIDWVEIPAGEFLMGSDKSQDPQAYDNETPQQKFHLDTFHISRHPITVAQYAAFVNGDGYTNPGYWTEAGLEWKGDRRVPDLWNDPKWHINNHPVVGVTWYEAYAFARWLSGQLGVDVSLPNEVQWEKAARGTDGRIYPYDGGFDPAKGNTRETGIERTSAVGIFPQGAAPRGVLDMSGNVWEWCLTKWGWKYADGIEAVDNDPAGAAARVLRGGSWFNRQNRARCACRVGDEPFNRGVSSGFRVVCARPPSQ